MTIEEVKRLFCSYPGWDEGGFEITRPKVGRAEWREKERLISDERTDSDNRTDNQLLMASVLARFAFEIQGYYKALAFPLDARARAEEKFSKTIGRLVAGTEKAIDALVDIVQRTGRKQMGDLTQARKKFASAKPHVRDVIVEWMVEQERHALRAHGHESNPERVAKKRLNLRLNDALKDCTKMTQDNRVHHILEIRDHYGIEGGKEEAVRKQISPSRSESELDTMFLEWDTMFLELDDWPFSGRGQKGDETL